MTKILSATPQYNAKMTKILSATPQYNAKMIEISSATPMVSSSSKRREKYTEDELYERPYYTYVKIKLKINGWHLKSSASPTREAFGSGLKEIRTHSSSESLFYGKK